MDGAPLHFGNTVCDIFKFLGRQIGRLGQTAQLSRSSELQCWLSTFGVKSRTLTFSPKSASLEWAKWQNQKRSPTFDFENTAIHVGRFALPSTHALSNMLHILHILLHNLQRWQILLFVYPLAHIFSTQ